MIIAETTEVTRAFVATGESEMKAVRICVPGGETVMVYVKVYRDEESGRIIAAEPVAKDVHGNRLPTFDEFLRRRKRERRDSHHDYVFVP